MDTTIRRKESFRNHGSLNKVRIWSRFIRGLRTGRLNSKKLAMAKATFWENTHEFSQNTTLHALKFVGDTKISIFERVFFFIAFGIALSIALNFIYNIYEKWSSTPVIIANSATSTYISEIPFPAVTICNMNQALKSKVSNLDRKSPKFSILQALCYRQDKVDNTNITSKWDDFEEFILESTQSCSSMLVSCKFASTPFNCTDFFRPVLTDEGRCCAFNTVDLAFMYRNFSVSGYVDTFMPKDYIAVDWTPEVGYPYRLPNKFYPTTASGTGFSMGLTIMLNADIDDYYCSSTSGAGFKVLLHSPVEIPNVGDNGFSLQIGHETRVVITPQLADASNTLRDMRREVRQCVFSGESNLSYFRAYSRRNCEMECEARLVAAECDCILYYMPRISPDISICGIKDSKCYETVSLQVQTANQDKNNCSQECMAACFDLTYDAGTYSAPILQGQFDIRERILHDMPREHAEKNIAIAHFYYIENAFRSRIKEQFVGFTEFLSSTGGLMGLFIGFSVISVVEIFYYATFRPFCASQRYKAKLRKNKPGTTARRRFLRLPFQNINRSFWASGNGSPSVSGEHLYDKKFKRMQGFGAENPTFIGADYLP